MHIRFAIKRSFHIATVMTIASMFGLRPPFAVAQCPLTWKSDPIGMNGKVSALLVYGGELIAGGHFTSAGGIPSSGIAKWNGSAWSALGEGVGGIGDVDFGAVHSLAVFNGELIAGGNFKTAGGIGASSIARWNGAIWLPLGTGIEYNPSDQGLVDALAVYKANSLLLDNSTWLEALRPSIWLHGMAIPGQHLIHPWNSLSRFFRWPPRVTNYT